MDKWDIMAKVKRSGTTFTQIAKDCGVSKTTITLVADGKMTSRHVATKISEVIGHSLDEIWPGKYIKKEDAA